MDQESNTENNVTANNVETKTEQPETQEQINWKQFRDAREQERKRSEELARIAKQKEAEAEALKAAMEALIDKKLPKNDNHSQYDIEEEDEDARIQKKINAALQERERQYEQQRIEKERQEFPRQLTQAYSDFDKVCNTENLDYLEYHHPEIAAAYKYMPDGFEKWSAVYKAVKKLVPNADNKRDQKKAEQNFNKPQSMSTPGATPVGDSAPHIMDDKRKQDNWARMQRIMKGG